MGGHYSLAILAGKWGYFPSAFVSRYRFFVVLFLKSEDGADCFSQNLYYTPRGQ